MALYSYEAFSRDGKRIHGKMDAASSSSVKEQLTRQGMLPIAISLAITSADESFISNLFRARISKKDLVIFTKQLAVLLKSGIPVMQAFELLIEQFEGQMKSILVSIRDHLKEGGLLADALLKYPDVFDKVYVQLVRAGESSGKLEIILEHLNSYLERNEQTALQIQRATRKPLNTLGLAIIVVSVLLIYVVPQLSETFAQQGRALPVPTTILIALSNFVVHWYVLLAVLILGVIASFKLWARTTHGKHTLDSIKIKLPLVKYITKTRAVVQFSYALGMLIDAGVNLPEALDIVCNIIDNSILSDSLKSAREKIVKQGKITEYLKQTNMFPPVAIYLIKTGEESSQLGQMLLMVAHNYEVELSDLVDNLIEKLDPIMMVFMSSIVGFIVMSIMLPIMQMGQGLE